MKDRNIFAYTAPGADFPEYLSINRRDDEIVMTVRTKGAGEEAKAVPKRRATRCNVAVLNSRPCRLNGARRARAI
jgi:hypothetical protein